MGKKSVAKAKVKAKKKEWILLPKTHNKLLFYSGILALGIGFLLLAKGSTVVSPILIILAYILILGGILI